MAKPRKRSKKTDARRAAKLAESAYKLGVDVGAKAMAKKSMEIMQAHLEDRALAEYVGDLFGYIGEAVWLETHLDVFLDDETDGCSIVWAE